MTVFDVMDYAAFGDLLSVGALGFVAGVVIPWPMRAIGYIVDSVWTILR